MDFDEFRRGKVWLKVSYGPDIDPTEDPRYRPPRFEARIAYAPAMLDDSDRELIASIERVRVDFFPTTAPPADNRAQRRARDKAARRAAATPPGKDDRPTLLDFMKRLIVDWDLTVGGEPLPVSEEVLGQFEVGLQLEIVGTIVKDYLERPNLTSLSKLFSAATTANGQTGQTSASEPSSTEEASSPGTMVAFPTSDMLPSGTSG